MTTPTTRRAALGALASIPALAIPAAAIAASAPSAGSEEPATAEQYAEMNFEPWKHGGNEEWEPPSNVKWAEDGAYLLPFVRMAWICMYKTKPELETLAEELEDEPFEEMVEGIHHSLEFFENFVTVLQAAEIRIMCAASAVEFRAGASDETS